MPLSHIEPGPVRIDRPGPAGDGERLMTDAFWVSPEYFRALAIPLKRGRLLTDQDGVTAPPAALVSESFALAQFPGEDPLGRRIQVLRGEEQAWLTIVGIVGDVRYDALDREARQAVYEPLAMNPFHYTRLVVRADGDPRRIEGAVRAVLRDSGTAQAVFHVQPMEDYIAASLADRRFALSLIAVFGVLALVLSAVGLYGVMSYAVLCRTSEIGVRAALGAGRGHVLGLILRQGMSLAGAGLALGLVAGLGATRLLASFLYGTGPNDPITLAATIAVLAIAAAACVLRPGAGRDADRSAPGDEALKLLNVPPEGGSYRRVSVPAPESPIPDPRSPIPDPRSRSLPLLLEDLPERLGADLSHALDFEPRALVLLRRLVRLLALQLAIALEPRRRAACRRRRRRRTAQPGSPA